MGLLTGLGMLGGGLANALGLGLEGYSKDLETKAKRERDRIAALQAANEYGLQVESHTANMAKLKREAAAATDAEAGNLEAYKNLPTSHPAKSIPYNRALPYAQLGLDYSKTQDEDKGMLTALEAFRDQPTVARVLNAAGGYNRQQHGSLKSLLEVAQKHADEAAALERAKIRPPQLPAIVQGVDAQGNPIVATVDRSTNTATPVKGLTPAPKTGAGGTTMEAKRQGLNNTSDALDQFEAALKDAGPQIWPGVQKDVLEAAYKNLGMQMKDMYGLGVLNGGDLVQLTGIIHDPASIWGRTLAVGDAGEQSKRIQAQVGQVRGMLAGFKKRLEEGATRGAPARPAPPIDIDAWKAANPPQAGESPLAYHARFWKQENPQQPGETPAAWDARLAAAQRRR